ncbi:hypothetical protein MMC34_006639 [Xylographa carneopallida]|nr:hypothetical protein [Xylographa carneopallida]
MGLSGQHGAQTWTQRPDYKTYKSPYGPGYTVNKNFHGIDLRRATKLYVMHPPYLHFLPAGNSTLMALKSYSGITAGSFGAVAGIFALFFFSDVPKVRKDIMQKIPIIGDQFDKSVPPSDNPF